MGDLTLEEMLNSVKTVLEWRCEDEPNEIYAGEVYLWEMDSFICATSLTVRIGLEEPSIDQADEGKQYFVEISAYDSDIKKKFVLGKSYGDELKDYHELAIRTHNLLVRDIERNLLERYRAKGVNDRRIMR